MSTQNAPILVYGTNWCPDCMRVRKYLDSNNIDYNWVDINNDPAACAIVVKVNHGLQSVPTMLWPDGSLLVEPSIKQLKAKLGL